MKIRSKETYWLIKNALPASYPSLKTNISVPVVIIGGGVTGALIAYKLINEGKKPILVDRRDICNGSSAASTAMLQYEIDTPLHKLIELRGEECAVRSFKDCEKAIGELQTIVNDIKSDCQFESKKSIYFASSKKDVDFLKEEFDCRKKHGFKVKWLDKDALQKTGVKGYAAIESVSAAVMDPYKFANDLLNFCVKKGLTIYDRTSIKDIKEKDGKHLLRTEDKFTITAEHVIHCTGYESTQTLEEKVVDLKNTYAIASEAFEKLPKAFEKAIYWDTAEPYLYFRSTADGRIIMGGEDDKFKNEVKRDASLPKKAQRLVKQFGKCFPDIPFTLDYEWAGTFGETKDGLPYIGKENEETNEHYVLGFGGNGITFSVMAMDCIVESMAGQAHPYLQYYKFGR